MFIEFRWLPVSVQQAPVEGSVPIMDDHGRPVMCVLQYCLEERDPADFTQVRKVWSTVPVEKRSQLVSQPFTKRGTSA